MGNKNKPFLSIVMPVYNAEPYIRQAVTSILNQTYRDFELIVINDASTDHSLEIVHEFKDSRIKVINNEHNCGIVYSRNRGNQYASGKYIAPFDADDIARKDKFEKQISFLVKHPEYGMIGSWAILIDERGNILKKRWKVNAPPQRIPSIQLFRNYFIQSAVVLRREAIPSGNYTEGYDVVEDYKMWFDISRNYKIWNYPEYLLQYRVHAKSITQKEKEKMSGRDLMVFDYIYKSLNFNISSKQKSILLLIKNNSPFNEKSILNDIEKLLLDILEMNRQSCILSQKELIKVVHNRWVKSCYKAGLHNFRVLIKFFTSPIHTQMIRNTISKNDS